MYKNRSGQTLITVVVLLFFLLFLGMALVGSTTNQILRTNALVAHGDSETTSSVLADASFLLLSDQYDRAIEEALGDARSGQSGRYNLSRYSRTLQDELDSLPSWIEDELNDFMLEELQEEYLVNAELRDPFEDSVRLVVEAENQATGTTYTLSFFIHKPSLEEQPQEEGNSQDEPLYLLTGTNPLILFESMQSEV